MITRKNSVHIVDIRHSDYNQSLMFVLDVVKKYQTVNEIKDTDTIQEKQVGLDLWR